MSNKTQILCNNNSLQTKIIKDCWERISSNSKTLLELNNKKEELINEINQRRKENKHTSIQMVKLGRIFKEIEFYNMMNNVVWIWLKNSKNKLVIC